MRILLDENVPVQALELLRRVLRGHYVDHVEDIGWKGRIDRVLIPNIASSGYDVFITKDVNQLNDPDECRAIQKARIHHVTFRQEKGLRGLALAVGALIAATPRIVEELEEALGPRLVEVVSLRDQPRHRMIDPAHHPPPYWP